MPDVIRKFWKTLERRERRRIALTLVLLLASSLIQMLGVGSILPLMAVLSRPGIIHSNPWLHKAYSVFGFTSDTHFLFFLGLCSLATILISNAFLALNQWITVHLWGAIQHRVAVRLLQGYINAPYLLHLRRSPAELKRNVLDESLRFAAVLDLSLKFAASVFLILCITALLLAVNPVLCLLIGALLGGGYAVIYLAVRHRMARIGDERLKANLQRYKMVDEGLGGLKELKLLQRTTWMMRRFIKASNVLTDTLAKKSVLDTVPRYFIEVLGFGSMLLILLYLLASGADLRDSIPLMSLFAFGAYRMLPAMQGLYNSTMGLRFYAPVGSSMYEELGDSARRMAAAHPDGPEEQPLIFRRAIELHHISFAFSKERSEALRDISLTIPCRAFIGIAGETGSGKTTLADVILGLLTPETGNVTVDGVPLKGDNIARWQRLLGYVPQDVYLADDTIESNIAFGLPVDRIDKEAVREAARLAQIQTFIEEELRLEYQTPVGDRGVRLSGGQRQRIGIARALYHGPQVLVLDEATSQLDGETEAHVFSAIEKLAHHVTLIVIAHRLTTIKRADRIYLLEKGKLAAQGTFSELLEHSQQFKNMAHGLT